MSPVRKLRTVHHNRSWFAIHNYNVMTMLNGKRKTIDVRFDVIWGMNTGMGKCGFITIVVSGDR